MGVFEGGVTLINNDRQAWKNNIRNPVRMLNDFPQEVLESAANNPEYPEHYGLVIKRFQEYMETKRCWFAENITDSSCLPLLIFQQSIDYIIPFHFMQVD
jgi:glucan phosphorylase